MTYQMLTVRELTQERIEEAKRHHQIYSSIWQDLQSRIVSANKAHAFQLEYRCSPFTLMSLGLPLVDLTRAGRYLHDKLIRAGFAVSISSTTAGIILSTNWAPSQEMLKSCLTDRPGRNIEHANEAEPNLLLDDLARCL